jgi:HSP20 family molecular chaperone IbpA
MNDLIRWDPFKAVCPFEDSFFALPAVFRANSVREPGAAARMDVAETDTSYKLAIELAGVSKEAIQVSVRENTVTVNAELAAAPQDEARYLDGVLYLTLKKKSATNVKRLTVH